MKISKKNFFTNNEVLFIGVSYNPKSFSRSVLRDFIKAGIKVYAMNTKYFKIEDVEVNTRLESLPKVPECAYILLNKENTREAVKGLKEKGVKKILFHSKATVDSKTIKECEEMGLEVFVACPKMLISKAPIHKIHGFLAGVRK